MSQIDFKISLVNDHLDAECYSDGWEIKGKPFQLDENLPDLLEEIQESLHSEDRAIRPKIIRMFGKSLYRSILPENIGKKVDEILQGLNQEDHLRLILDIHPANLSIYPWEYLYSHNQGKFLCMHPRITLSRWVSLQQPYQPLTVDLPLQILVVFSSPPGTRKIPEEIGDALANLLDNVPESPITIEIMRNPSISEIGDKVRSGRYHILHYLGHGEFVKGSGHLILRDDRGQPGLVNEEIVATHFLAASTIRLVCLTACYSGGHAYYNAFSGVAMKLMQNGIPAVVAMQNAISAKDALCFSKSFYRAIAEGLPVDVAVQQGRCAIPMENISSGEIRCDFGTPILFMRTRETNLFRFVQSGDETRTEEEERPASSGMSALARLMKERKVLEKVILFQDVFKESRSHIDLLKLYKQLHDQLHQLQINFYCLFVDEAGRFPEDETSSRNLKAHWKKFRTVTEELEHIAGQPFFDSSQSRWINDLNESQKKLEEALEISDKALLDESVRLLTRVLRTQPSRINTRLNATARGLRLYDLVNTLKQIGEKLLPLNLNPESLREFISGIDDLEQLHHQLNTLVKDHDDWQQIEDDLRLIESTLMGDTTYLEQDWPRLSVNISSMFTNSTEKWAEKLKSIHKKLDIAIVQKNPRDIRSCFVDYLWEISYRFYWVDKSLKQLCCRDIPKIGESLAPVINMMRVTS